MQYLNIIIFYKYKLLLTEYAFWKLLIRTTFSLEDLKGSLYNSGANKEK